MGFLHRESQPKGCSLERSPGSLERTSFCLGGSLPETCPLEQTLGKLEWTSLWLWPLERTSGRLERRMFWMSPLERTYHRSSEPDAVKFWTWMRKRKGLRGLLEGRKLDHVKWLKFDMVPLKLIISNNIRTPNYFWTLIFEFQLHWDQIKVLSMKAN